MPTGVYPANQAVRTATCHPERKHYGRGLCEPCHQRDFRARNPTYQRDYQRRRYTPERGRAARLRARFGLNPTQYDAMLAQQNGLCAICKREPGGRWNRLAVDHDHETGAVRGLLCHRCNQMLGQSNDHAEIFDAAAAYLRAGKKGAKP